MENQTIKINKIVNNNKHNLNLKRIGRQNLLFQKI